MRSGGRGKFGGRGLLTWLQGRKTLASAAAIAVLVGVPVGVAVSHKGFPVSNVSLHGLDVWVTNGADLLAGRLNHQIDQLDASLAGSSQDLDVLQDGSAYFLVDSDQGTLQRVDPAYVSTTEQVTIPKGSWVGYGDDTIAILAPDGRLWDINAQDRLAFDASKTKPVAQLGAGAAATVAKTGTVFAVSPKQSTFVSVSAPGKKAQVTKGFAVSGDPQISAVGGTAVVLDKGGSRLRTPTATLTLPGAGLRLQQPSAASSDVLVASASDLYRVPLGGGQTDSVAAGGTTPAATTAAQVSAPVQLGGCDYGAWASSGRYVYACQNSKAVSIDIGKPVSSDDLRFRVNHGVVALNDVRNGDAWVASRHLTLVQNWQQLKPTNTQQKKGKTGQQQTVVQTYEDAIAHRTNTNHEPKPENDTFGVRPGRTTLLPVLNNDQDPDGDVLTISSFSAVPRSFGVVEAVDGGRALQLDPAPGVTGGVTFRYTVIDGRGGEAAAQVTLNVHQESTEQASVPQRRSSVSVEQNQSITYNVLQDWIDPDGDAIYLASATKTTADSVSFTPDGDITFDNKSDQVGVKDVDFVVSDGRKTAQGKLEVTVKASGSLAAVAVPDYAQVELGRPTTINPLTNDTSPSGAPLSLVSATSTDPSLSLRVDQAQGTISVTGEATGTYYFTYQLGAGSRAPVPGLVRIDVVQPAQQNAPPIAVSDVVYVHPGQTASVDPLDNDVSPSGRVLAVQSVTGGADASALNVQLLDNTQVKVTSPGVLQKQVQLTYELSDGLHTVPGTITVVPVAPLVNYQPPVAVSDYVNIRAGDIATVPVLDNDYSPDDQPFTLDSTLASTKDDGGATAFVSGSDVRLQAPSKPGTYSVTYAVSDEHSQSARASVIFTVLPANGNDQAPQPQTLTARAFAGSAIPLTIPLNGIDPDGDSVFFEGVTSQPKLGTITGVTATGFVYQAAASAAGTDDLSYRVVDTYGKAATGQIRIGVIPRPTSLQPPTAVNDKVEVKPGKTGSVSVLANDSDPNGYPLTLQKKLTADKGLTDVGEDGSAVLFTAPKTEGDYLIHYTVSNGHGGTAGAYVQVIVSSTARPRYPTAVDHYVNTANAKGKASVSLDALDGATNPSGPVSALSVAAVGSNASLAKVNGANVTVTLQSKRTVIAYQVTDPATKLTGKAFIILPPATVKQDVKPTTNPEQDQRAVDKKTTPPPHLKSGLHEVTPMNTAKSFSLSQIVDVPSGRPATITAGVTAQHGSVTGSGSGFTFTPANNYRGPAAVTFNVDDGKEQGSTSDRITPITLPITVGAADESDVPPTFTPPNVQVEPGEAPKSIDLRAATYHPNPQIKNRITYNGLANTKVNGVTGSLSGSTLTVSAPVDAKPGTTAVFNFKVVPPSGNAINGSVNVTVESSTRPLAQQKNPPQTESTKRGTSVTLADAVGTKYWVNPFPNTPLTITDATLANAPPGVRVSHTDSSITVDAASGAAIGTVSVNYHVQDATKDPTRTAQVVGQLQVTIHDVPDQPSAPSNVSASDRQATMTIDAPAANGKAISGYEVRDTGKTVDVTPATAGTVQLSNLTNGKTYSFQVRAKNADGWGAWSTASVAVTPYGNPSAPSSAQLSKENQYAPSPLDMSWSPVTGAATGGLSISYEWKLSDGNSGTTTATSRTTASKKAGSYYFQVRTVGTKNNGQKVYSTYTKSNTVSFTDPPPPPASATISKGASTGYIPKTSSGDCTSGHCYYYVVQAKNFKPGWYYINLYCDNNYQYRYHVDIETSPWNFNSQNNTGQHYCGFPNAYATFTGGPSSPVSTKKADFSG